MRSLTLFVLGCSLCVSNSTAQQDLFIPSASATTDQSTAQTVAGFAHSARQQIILDASLLANVVGKNLTALSFRRDAATEHALEAGSADLTVVLSPVTSNARDASSDFEDNLDPTVTNRVTVFSGPVLLPASPNTTSRSVSWSNAHDVVTISFTTAYLYNGGNLCIDITGTPTVGQESTKWVVDGTMDTARGTATRIGSSCNSVGLANVASRELIPGSTTKFRGIGPKNVAGAFFMGNPMSAFDLSLIGVAAPGCELYVSPFATVPVSFIEVSPQGPRGASRLSVRFPANIGSFGITFRVQYAWLNPTVETSNAVDCVLASQLPTLNAAMVAAPLDGGSPTTGVVQAHSIPVVRLTAQAP